MESVNYARKIYIIIFFGGVYVLFCLGYIAHMRIYAKGLD